MSLGWRAYALARVRAMRGRLVAPETALVLRGAGGARGVASAFEALGLDAADAAATRRILDARLGARLHKLARLYPDAAALFQALAGLEEVENLKLGWRAVARRIPAPRWRPDFRDLGPAATLHPEHFQGLGALHEVRDAVSRTPWGEVARTAWRTHEADLPAAALAFDQAAGRRVVDAARALPAAEHLAAGLALEAVVDRDLEVLARARRHGLGPEAAVGALAYLPERVRPAALRALAEHPGQPGLLAPKVPRAILRDAAGVGTFDDLLAARRELRRAACLRALRVGGFTLGPPVAFALLAAAEVRGLTAIAEAGGDAAVTPVVEDVLAASAMEA